MRRSATAAAVLTSALVGGSVYSASRRLRRLRDTPDPDPLPPLRRPDGTRRTVVTDDGTELATITTSANDEHGPTIVLGHGWTSDLRSWQLVHDPLVVAGYRVVTWDQRGHGQSTVGSSGFGVEQLGSDLAAVLTQLDVRDAIVVGHSMGGIGVQSLALGHSAVVAERVRGLVLVSTVGRSVPGIPLGAIRRLLDSDLYERQRERRSALATLVQLRAFGPGIRPSIVERNRDVFLDCPTSTVIGALEPLVDFDLTDRLHTITTPTLVVTSDVDRVTPTSRSRELHQLLTDARIHSFAGVGHMIPLERPTELAGMIDRLVGELSELAVGS